VDLIGRRCPVPRNLSFTGLVLLLLFLLIAAGAVFPIAILDSAWQLRLGAVLINSAPLPLMGLAILHLALYLDKQDELLVRRRRIAAALALPVALGYLLLVPLLGTAVERQQAAQLQGPQLRLRRASTQLREVRAAVRSATSAEDLSRRLVALQAPELAANQQNLSLEQQRLLMNTTLDRAAVQIARQQEAMPSANPWLLAPEILRTTLACMALAAGLAALTRRLKADSSVLDEVQQSWRGMVRLRRNPRRSRVAASDDRIAALSDPQDSEPRT
jgi:hypothetical protein